MYSFLDDNDESHQKLYNAVARCGNLVLQVGQKDHSSIPHETHVGGESTDSKVRGKVPEPLDCWSLTFNQFYDAVRTDSLLSEFFVQDWPINNAAVGSL